MNDSKIVSAQGISKFYLLYNQPQDRLKQSIFGRFGKNYARTFWALRDVSFELQRGEVLGLIGRNGSGKSTILQIVAGTLQPTYGSMDVKGRITALLELGAGFNPEFTGRENIFLNGATLGIPEKKMRNLAEEIIDFAQIGDFIDQPVKIYSSGMFVRLAFSIATVVDPDVLIIDEALAVGDIGFVMKCMNRLKKMREQGATILLATHDVQTVRSFCDKAIWLHQGEMALAGAPLEVTSRYMEFLFNEQTNTAAVVTKPGYTSEISAAGADGWIEFERQLNLIRWGSQEIKIEAGSLVCGESAGNSVFEYGQEMVLQMRIKALRDVPSETVGFGFAFRNSKGLDVITSTTYDQGTRIPPLRAGQSLLIRFRLKNILAPGDYALILNVENRDEASPHYYDFVENGVLFKVTASTLIHSLVLPDIEQKLILLDEGSQR